MAVAGNLASEEPFSVTMDKVRHPQLWREGRYDRANGIEACSGFRGFSPLAGIRCLELFKL